MEGLGDIAIRVVSSTGVVGAIIVAVLISLVLGVILYARTRGLFAETMTATQQGEFQKKLLDAIDRLTKIETSLRDEIESLQNEKAQLQRALNEATVSIELMRIQQRHIIDLFRDVLAGKRALATVSPEEFGA